MPSIFSRARTSSTPGKHKPPRPSLVNATAPPPLPADEFGLMSPGAGPRSPAPAAPAPSTGFLPTALPAAAQPPPGHRAQAYGLLSPARDAVLGLGDAARLVQRVCRELEREGVAMPFVFSALALDVRRAGVARLVQAFLGTCVDGGGVPNGSGHGSNGGGGGAEARWAEEARFAGPHELGMCLRWGLARVVRVEGGREVRGLLNWAWYECWRADEAASHYPPTAFSSFIDSLPAQLPPILQPLFALAGRQVAHSAVSGETPPSLAAVLGPLLFGLSAPHALPPPPPTTSSKSAAAAEELLVPTVEDFSSFGETYTAYLRSARAAEHLLLASIRGDLAGSLAVPTRLREWVAGYPASLELPSAINSKVGARHGAKTVRVCHVRRNVRSYAPDLVRGGSAWAASSSSGGGGGPGSEWASSRAWRSVLAGGSGEPRFAESYRKRLDLPASLHPETGSAASALTSPSTTSLSVGAGTDAAFRSLTDLKWGEFESLGFGSGGVDDGSTGGGFGFSRETEGIEGKLRFDLTENARAERLMKRETLSWTDFSTAGFTRSDAPLSATLQFSPPLSLSSSTSSTSSASSVGLNAELTRKLRKAHKALPAFGWDTVPVLGPEEVVEEAFVDVFCDLLWGGGWMERASGVGGVTAELARECSWALVEYKARTGAAQDSGSTVVLFEEFVPREYRLALAGAAPPGPRRRLPSLFSPNVAPGGGKTWKQAPTLNGRPYVVGATPSPSMRELDFEGMLRAQGNATKVITLGGVKSAAVSPITPAESPLSPLARPRSDSSADSSGGLKVSTSSSKRASASRFRLPGGIIPGPSPGNGGGLVRPGMPPAEYAAVEFETRLAGESDDEGGGSEEQAARQRRRESASDAWVDILVGSVQARRMGGQDAELRTGSGRRRGAFVSSPDPDLVSMEVAQALAAETMGREPSPPGSDEDEREARRRHRAQERERLRDSDVSEIETVPRTSEATDRSLDDEADFGAGTDGEDMDGDEDNLTPGAEMHPVLNQRQAARQQRRLGYFDLHPERRPASSIGTNDDDPRSLLSGPDSEEEEHDVPPARNLDIRPLPVPVPAVHVSPIDVPEFDDMEERRRADREHARSKADSMVLPPNGNGHSNEHPNVVAPKPGTPSKTSALIDMFREREQQRSSPKAAAPAPAPLAPSRLPVRTTSRDGASPTKPITLCPKHRQRL
ncbi:hypothetical protein B0H10DRAFT_196553 [Mycena sp. CBHHK59/15]|nr:hypothetical protein B0H10DRAFT_196553 [Mycena sp. CBHHK59/15]